jgi:hypothetical protein
MITSPRLTPMRRVMRLSSVSAVARRRRLNGEAAFDGVDDAGELDQGAVAHQLDDTAVVARHLRVEDEPAMRRERGQRARLVLAHQARVTDDIGGQYCGEPALHPPPPVIGDRKANLEQIDAILLGDR